MSKTLSAGTEASVALTTTTFAFFWKLKRTDGVIFAFTSHDKDLDIDIFDGDGEQTYKASSGFNRTSISSNDRLSPDEFNITGPVRLGDIDEDDLKRGLFSHAEIKMFQADFNQLSDGIIPLKSGRLGEVTLTSQGLFFAEMRGLAQAFSRRIGSLYTPLCRVDLGSPECGIPLRPPVILRDQAITVGQFFRVLVTPDPLAGGVITIVNGGFETDTPPSTNSITGWTIQSGDTWDIRTDDPFEGAQQLHISGSNPGTIRQEIELRSSQSGPIPDAALAVEDRVRIKTTVQINDAGENDTARLEIEALDSSDVVLETFPQSSGTGGAYLQLAVDETMPANTAKLRIDLIGAKSGATINLNFDDVQSVWVDTTLAAAPPEIPSTLFGDRVFKVTVAGTTNILQPTYDQTVGNTTVDGTATLIAEDSFARAIEVTAVDSTNPRKKFTVTELTPNSGGPRGGFPLLWFDLGAVVWESGDNLAKAMEVRKYTPDDGVTITQDLELYLAMPFDIKVGDVARVYPGCDLTFATCRDKFDIAINFRGYPHVPGQDDLLRYSDSKS